MQYVYHVVTERPMSAGQKLIFDDQNHNGVYHRVMTFKRIIEGEAVEGGLADLINADRSRWAKVAYRELALEKVRKDEFPDYPSRMACLYTSRTFEEAEKWATFFLEIGREVYSIVKLSVSGRIFDGDACNCFDGTESEHENVVKAMHYWKMDTTNEKPIIETLVDGEITVVEIIKDYKFERM